MRKVRFLNLAVTLGLVVGLFAAAIGTASADYGPGTPGASAIYFPYVANGDEADETGPWFSTVTVQNTEIYPIRISVTPYGGTAQTGVLLNPRASKTWTAAALGVPAPGAGVAVTADWDTAVGWGALANDGYCEIDPQLVTRPAAQAGAGSLTDRINTAALGYTGVKAVLNVTDGTTYVKGVDYDVEISGGSVAIIWRADGARPAFGANYTVDIVHDCASPRIAGVEKHATPAIGGNATTNGTTVAVDGYSAVSNVDVALSTNGGRVLDSQSRWVMPIVQTNSGWNTILYVTNISGKSNVGVTGTYYAENGQGFAGPSTMILNQLLAKDETVAIDLTNDAGFPAGEVGSVWIDSDDGAVVAQVYRLKGATNMALTTVAQPRTDNGNLAGVPFQFNPNAKYAPLVFRDYNGWNTGLNIANLSSNNNRVTITYYNYAGNVLAVDTKVIPARAMEVVYRPFTDNATAAAGAITSASIVGTQPLAAAVDEVKYISGTDQGQAMSYGAQHDIAAMFPAPQFRPGRVGYISKLALPLVQKGNAQTGTGDTSGINLFNPDESFGVTAYIQFVDTAGVPVAPTVGGADGEQPIVMPMGALSGATVYTMNYSEMPAGFVGAAVVGVGGPTLGGMQMPLVSSLVGVSNNVNYDVEFDGSAVFNMSPSFTFPPFFFNP